MKKFLTVFLTSVLFFTLFSSALASEKETSIDYAELVRTNEQEIRAGFDELEIDKETQNKLLEKLSNGEVIDSMKPENIEKAQKAVKDLGLGESKVITFEDGSKAEFGTEIVGFTPEGSNKSKEEIAVIAAKSPGTYQVKAYWNIVILSCFYYNDVVIRSGQYDYISSAYNPTISVIGGSYSGETLNIYRKYETSTRYAYSQLKFSYTVPTGNGTFNLYLNVGNDDWFATLSQSDVK
jgi:hypothetical protein